MSDDPLVWLPFDPADLGDPIPGLRLEHVEPSVDDLPDGPAGLREVRLYVPTYMSSASQRRVLAAMPSLEVVQTLTAGVDGIRADVPEGVTLCNGRGIHNASTAELALTLTLASLRGIPEFVRRQERHHWEQVRCPSLADRTVLILGYGDIGADIERRLVPFEVDVVRVARSARDGVHAQSELPDLLPEADVVVVVVPDTEQTRGMVDAGFLAAMKDGALLVNVARGSIVVTADLLAELDTGRLHAALDVVDPEPTPPDHPVWDAPNLLLTPHVGGASTAMTSRMHRVLRAQLERYAAGEPLANVVSGEY